MSSKISKNVQKSSSPWPKIFDALWDRGIKVKIFHYRYVAPKGEIDPDYDSLKRNFETSENEEILSRGGYTDVIVIDKDCNEYLGRAECSIEDAYCKKTGSLLAFKRAMKNLHNENPITKPEDYDYSFLSESSILDEPDWV